MLEDLVKKTMNQEIKAAVQMAYLAGKLDDSTLQESFLRFAMDELEHLGLLARFGANFESEPVSPEFKLHVETDAVKALILLQSIEDTLIGHWEGIVSGTDGAFRAQAEENLEKEREHLAEMKTILKKMLVKENAGQAGPG